MSLAYFVFQCPQPLIKSIRLFNNHNYIVANCSQFVKWSFSPFVEGTSEVRGTGLRNTARILLHEANAPAAKVCNEYENNGYTDGFTKLYGIV